MERKNRKKILLNSESEAPVKAPVKMGRPVNEEQRKKRLEYERLRDEERKIKKELRLQAKIESARRGRGRPRIKPGAPKTSPLKRMRPAYSFQPDPPKNIQRPPAVYDNKSIYDKYGV
jgi:hypothetical protein